MGSKVLIGRKAICNHLNISKHTFYELVRAGLPATKQAGTWVSHVDILEEYFRRAVEGSGNESNTSNRL